MLKRRIEQITKLISLYSSMRVKRDPDMFVFGSWWGERFADNPKYLFLYCVEHGYNVLWITKNEKVYHEMQKLNLPVELDGSDKARAFSRNAKYVFYCTSVGDVSHYNIGGATLINLWHGVPLKKIMYDDDYNVEDKKLVRRFLKWIVKKPYEKDYVVSTSDTISQIYRSAFRKNGDHILQLGQPRNDCFFNGYYKKRKYANIAYDKLSVYLPTHRKEGKETIDLESIFDLNQLNDLCKKHNCLFLIKKHFYHKNEAIDLSSFSNIIDCTCTSLDTQELMYNADLLITDYSSCYIDYLLLNRPVIFYNYDYEHYLLNDREMYFQYEDVTPGPKAHNFTELIESLNLMLTGENPYHDQLSAVRDLFYDPQNQECVSRRIMDEVSKLN